jgi:hypothetical protein
MHNMQMNQYGCAAGYQTRYASAEGALFFRLQAMRVQTSFAHEDFSSLFYNCPAEQRERFLLIRFSKELVDGLSRM